MSFRLVSVVLFILAICNSVVFSQADLIGTLENYPDASTFVQVLNNADDDVKAIFTSGDPLTLLVPSNVAFQNLAAYYNTSLETLLADTVFLDKLIQYHTLPRRYTVGDLRNQIGLVLPTQLTGAFIAVGATDDGRILLNTISKVSLANIGSGNTIIHIIDDALLNRVMGEVAGLSTVATQTPTPETSAPLTNDLATVPQSVANIRVGNFSTDTNALNVFINGVLLRESVAFPTMSEFLSVIPSSYEIAFSPTTYDQAIAKLDGVSLEDSAFLSVILLGSQTNGTLKIETKAQNLGELASTNSQLLFIHAVDGLGNLDFRLDDTLISENVGYGQAVESQQVAGVYTRHFVATGTTNDVFPSNQLSLWGGTSYVLALVGTADAPQLVASSVNGDVIAFLKTGAGLLPSSVSATVIEATDEQSLLEIISANPDFSTFRLALEVARPNVRDVLSAPEENVAVFVPNNQAFINLYTTVGITQDMFFANPDLVTQILEYHVITQPLLMADLMARDTQSIPTLATDQFLVVTVSGETIFLNRIVQVGSSDIEAVNGVLHSIDNVLLPQTAIQALGL